TGTPMPGQGDCPEPDELCVDEAQGFPFGYCLQQCGGGTACPAGSDCVTLGGRFPVCLLSCTMNTDCRVEDGYECATTGGSMVCLPADAPIGTRNGAACYTTAAGPHQLPALARTTFASANLGASESRADTSFEAEGNVAVNPVRGNVTVSYIAESRGGVFMGTSTTADGTTVLPNGTVHDPMHPATSDPVLAYTVDGTLHMVFLGYAYSSSGQPMNMRVRVTESTDDGATWATARAIEPTTFCAAGCDKPWIAVGPGPSGTGEAMYVGFLQETSTAANLVTLRSLDGGMTWTPPTVYAAGPLNIGGSNVIPNLQTFVVGPDGVLHVTYVGLSATNQRANYGDVNNRIAYRRSADGGTTWGPTRRVSAATDTPVYNQPMLDIDGSTIYIAYTAGTPQGAWDIMLATSPDGGTTWQYRKVNDEPDACATHELPALAADRARHVVHVTWYENRFGAAQGAVAYASCAQDPAIRCGVNEAVSDTPFAVTTARDPSIWHGDYMGLAVAPSGALWAGWSDTRAGGPHMYLTRGTPH
ncbi:MAG: sialidase family protein, partial [Deltaproteobacteria bacterium]